MQAQNAITKRPPAGQKNFGGRGARPTQALLYQPAVRLLIWWNNNDTVSRLTCDTFIESRSFSRTSVLPKHRWIPRHGEKLMEGILGGSYTTWDRRPARESSRLV